MTITKLHNGALEISTIHKGYLKTQVYYDYTIKEAKALFKEYLKTV